jgi:hypothetical protein
MESHSRWYNDIAKQVDITAGKLDSKNNRKYKVELLLCLAERVDSFNDICSQCQSFKQELGELSKTLATFAELISMRAPVPKDQRKGYFKTIDSIIQHLQKQNRLVMEGQYIGLCMSVGTALGLALGAVMDHAGAGIPIGIGLGTALGTFLDWKAKKEGRVICPRSSTTLPRNDQIRWVIAGLVILLIIGMVLFFYLGRSQIE